MPPVLSFALNVTAPTTGCVRALLLAAGLASITAMGGCSSSTSSGSAATDEPVAGAASAEPASVAGPGLADSIPGPGGEPTARAPLLAIGPDWHQRDGYGTVDVVRLDVRTATTPGICVPGDESGCTLADVLADTDRTDDFKVDIPVHLTTDEYPEDGQPSNAELRQRGGYTRLAPQKSFRIKLDSKENLWRNERRLQLNKMPYDTSRLRNKLAFDLMAGIPDLPSIRTQFVNLWIDDGQGPADQGLFTHMEYVGKEYLQNRDLNTDDRIYKIEEFVFSGGELAKLQLDAEGEPVDKAAFETVLGIESGHDHRALLRMIEAVNDNELPFNEVLARHFDADNVRAWVTVNFLLHQVDAVTHNFYLYNPEGSDTFYFLPWDYDGAFNVEPEPADSFETEALLKRLYYGYAKGRASGFLNRYYRQPGLHAQVTALADELRRGPLMDSLITELATRYASVVSPYAGRQPDLANNTSYSASNSSGFAEFVAQNHVALRSYGIPLPPKLDTPDVEGDSLVFGWKPAHDMNGNAMTYDIEVSASPGFEIDQRVLLIEGIEPTPVHEHRVPLAQIGSGQFYARLVARVASDPARYWQIASNRPEIDGAMRVGVVAFDLP